MNFENLENAITLESKLLEDIELKIIELQSQKSFILNRLNGLRSAYSIVKPTIKKRFRENLREGSTVEKIRCFLKNKENGAHINDILKAVGLSYDKKLSLAGSLSNYIRNGNTFTKKGPNIFGLIEYVKKDEI